MENRHLKKSNDRIWITLIVIALVFETLWLLTDLNWISLPLFSHKKSISGSAEAGYVMKAKEDLRRRSADSLIWENTHEKDTLYYRDSVLTLAEGSARLYLKDQTELQLSENTLVTLEEPDDRSTSEIRLRFSRGDLRARNPVARTNIVGDDWLVNLERGSEVALRKDSDSYEFEVLAGKAFLQTSKGSEDLTSAKILKLGADKNIQQIEKSRELEWNDTKPLRVYSFGDSAEVALNWKGKATNLILNRSGESEKTRPLESSGSTKLDLPLGSYKVRLQDESGVSTARDVEIWKAPHIVPKKPLPRDRLKAGDNVEFVWSAEDGVKSYRLKVGDRTETVTGNTKVIQLQGESDLDWKVEGLDEDGNVIPALYENKVYLRQEPLQAPKLKPPKVNIKSKPSSGFHWLQLFINQAYAAAQDEITFEWEPVSGADYYVIEVSSDPDFRKPELIQNLKTTKFIWKKYDPKKRYFWRVASGTTRGRMGFFSAAIEVKPETYQEEPEEKEPAVIAEQPVAEAPVMTPEPPVEPSAPLVLPSGFGLAWAPSYTLVDVKGEQKSRIRLGGGVASGVLFEVKKNNYHFSLRTASQLWKPTPEADFPFQDNLNIAQTRVNFSAGNYGVTFHQSFIPVRRSDESVGFQEVWIGGFRYSGDFWGASAASSGKIHELGIDLNFKKYLAPEQTGIRIYYGAGADLIYQMQKDGGGYQGNLIFLLGTDSF